MITVRKTRLVNPQKFGSTRAKRPRRSNPSLITLGFTNPQRSLMAKTRKRKSATTARRRRNVSTVTRRRRRNPSHSHSAARVRRRRRNRTAKVTIRRRRNPSRSSQGMLGKSTDMVKVGTAALVGFVATRQLPQMLLGVKNTGLMGYIANIIAAGATYIGVSKAAGPAAARAAAIGGSMYFASRLLNEYVSPVGKILSLSGVGDAQAAGLGDIRKAYFPLPVSYQPGTFNANIPSALQPKAVAAPQAAASAAPALSGVRRQGRFTSRYGR